MIRQGSAIVTEAAITVLPAAPLHALELWSDPAGAAARIRKACRVELPVLGRCSSKGALRLIRYEPTVWLVEGDPAPLAAALGGDGALTAIGGGIVRVELSGPGWRRLLMEGGVFDAENPAFAPGCSAATVIDHVNVRLLVTGEDSCLAYIPASYSVDLIDFWRSAATALD
jgi:heterotetrameric sarcosine oxidase gamma subunit